MCTMTFGKDPLPVLRLLKQLADNGEEHTEYFQQVLDRYIRLILTNGPLQGLYARRAIIYLRSIDQIGTLNVSYMVEQLNEVVKQQKTPV